MIIYGVAILAFCYIAGQLFGDFLGKWLGTSANVGGVGFAMLLLILLTDWLKRHQKIEPLSERGIQFWTNMYIPIVVAMAATQNVKVAVSSGLIAILAGIFPVGICIALVPVLSKFSKNDTP